MFGKTVLTAAAVAATLTAALPASPAHADVDVDIGIGVGGYFPGYPVYGDDHYPEGRYHGGYWHHERRWMSCYRGAGIVDDAGFYRVRPLDCSAPNYAYTAWKRGTKFVVRVNSYGAITSIRRVF